MEIGLFIKKNAVIISALTFTLIMSIVLIYMVNSSYAKLKHWDSEVTEIIKKEQSFQNADWELSPGNLAIAKVNADKAVMTYDSMIVDLAEQFAVPDYEGENIHPTRMKDQIINKIDSWKIGLERGKVNTNIADFTFGSWTKEGTLPGLKDIPTIRKNLDLVEELINKVRDAKIQSLEGLTRKKNNDLYPEARDLYSYLRFTMTMSGDISQIRTFINSLNNSRYCFVVQRVQLVGPDLTAGLSYPQAGVVESAGTTPGNKNPGSTPPGMNFGDPLPPIGALTGGQNTTADDNTDDTPQLKPLELEDRIVFKELTKLKMTIVIDYVEFQQPPEQPDTEEAE